MGRKVQPIYASRRQILVLLVVVISALAAIVVWQKHSRARLAELPSARVQLSEFRTTPTQALEGQRGSDVLYQAEARVRYAAGGQLYDRWLPILSRSDNKQLLEFELHLLESTACYVHWSKGQPDNAFLTCDKVTTPR